MSTRTLILILCVVMITTLVVLPALAQQNSSSSEAGNNGTVEGTVVSTSPTTLVARSDDNQYHLFTVDRRAEPKAAKPGDRVRVVAGPPDENGTREASSVAVLRDGPVDKAAEAAPVPAKVRDVESDIRRESRRWRLGVQTGAALDPELFTFGVQSQMGPIFSPRVQFRPNAEFAFGEVTDLIALNFEPVYRLPGYRRGETKSWTPFVGAGPAMIFIHQSYHQGRDINFGNFDYKTGFNILAGLQSRHGTFVELKNSLWSGPAPKLRFIVGYTF